MPSTLMLLVMALPALGCLIGVVACRLFVERRYYLVAQPKRDPVSLRVRARDSGQFVLHSLAKLIGP